MGELTQEDINKFCAEYDAESEFDRQMMATMKRDADQINGVIRQYIFIIYLVNSKGLRVLGKYTNEETAAINHIKNLIKTHKLDLINEAGELCKYSEEESFIEKNFWNEAILPKRKSKIVLEVTALLYYAHSKNLELLRKGAVHDEIKIPKKDIWYKYYDDYQFDYTCEITRAGEWAITKI